MNIKFVPPESEDFARLTKLLDEYYFTLVGDVHLRYAKYNIPSLFRTRTVVYDGSDAVACGCWKEIDEESAEIKRIYVLPEYRRKGIASLIIRTLEDDIKKAGKKKIILETARTTPDSEALYLHLGYSEIDYYGSPAGAENCLCFEKNI